jgi:hypothetical protein
MKHLLHSIYFFEEVLSLQFHEIPGIFREMTEINYVSPKLSDNSERIQSNKQINDIRKIRKKTFT